MRIANYLGGMILATGLAGAATADIAENEDSATNAMIERRAA